MNFADLAAHLETYLGLAFSTLVLATAAGIPLGIAASHVPALRGPILALSNIGRAVPSLAMLTFMIPLFGLGFGAALAALWLLAVPPIVINTDLGFRSVPAAALDAATGMGMSPMQRLVRVEWPLALAVVFAGVRTAGTEVVASAVLAAFIGAGGLGEYITTGLQANQPGELWTGVIAIAVLALVVEYLLASIQRRLGEIA